MSLPGNTMKSLVVLFVAAVVVILLVLATAPQAQPGTWNFTGQAQVEEGFGK